MDAKITLTAADIRILKILSKYRQDGPDKMFLGPENRPETRRHFARLERQGLIKVLYPAWDGHWYGITDAGREAVQS